METAEISCPETRCLLSVLSQRTVPGFDVLHHDTANTDFPHDSSHYPVHSPVSPDTGLVLVATGNARQSVAWLALSSFVFFLLFRLCFSFNHFLAPRGKHDE